MVFPCRSIRITLSTDSAPPKPQRMLYTTNNNLTIVLVQPKAKILQLLKFVLFVRMKKKIRLEKLITSYRRSTLKITSK